MDGAERSIPSYIRATELVEDLFFLSDERSLRAVLHWQSSARNLNQAMHLYAVGVGSNRPHGRHGRPAQVVQAAITELSCKFELFDASPVLLNPATGGAGRDFANAAALVESSLAPAAMLTALKGIERGFGRRPGRRWAARVLDLDLLLWSGGKVSGRLLTIPHPHLAEREFALRPLATIAPNWPVGSGLAVRHLLAQLSRTRPSQE